MRILLDECIDWRLSRSIHGHEVGTVRQLGWTGIENGELLALASEQFNIFIAVDRNLSFQQNLETLPMVVIVLRTKSNRLVDLEPLVPNLLEVIRTCRLNAVTVIGEAS